VPILRLPYDVARDDGDEPDHDALTVAILAGGRGSRLGGVDKATLVLGSRTILDLILDAVGPLAQEVIVVANDDRLTGDPRLTVIRDPDPHAGVLPALLAALDAATTPLLLLVACDMPFVSAQVVSMLARLAADHDAVVPDVDGHLQPMLAIYRVEPCRAAIQAAIARGDRRMISFLDDLPTRRVAEVELRAADPELRSFFNVNTPADLDAARALTARP